MLGRSGLQVSRLGLGTMTWGRDTDEHEAADQLKAFLEAGGTLLDTAAGYGDGESERVIGQLLASVVDREDVVLATKAGISRRTGERVVDTSRRALLDALDGSLQRLGTDHVDLWQVHTWSDDVAARGDARRGRPCGRDRAGALRRRLELLGLADRAGGDVPASLAGTRPAGLDADGVLAAAARRSSARCCRCAAALGLGVLPWSPLGRGVLTGKYRTGVPADSRAASPHFAAFVERYLDDRSRSIVDAVHTAAEGLDAAPVEVALAWVRDAPGVTAPIVGARTAAQLRGSLTSERLTLPTEIRSALDDVSAPPIDYPER